MSEENNQVCIGIDLGTTNSSVACIHKQAPFVIRIDNSPFMPSVVSLGSDGQILVGQAAVNNELISPLDTIRLIKRKMGRDELLRIGNNTYTPPMISSLILTRLKKAAEDFLGCAVTKAVISVPAFFNEQQREATKEAAECAGLELMRLINEPTAAACTYSIGSKTSECCLVYDLGGGTFDVSIVDLSSKIMEVRASHGDTQLGGADFDKLIAEQARLSFLKEHQIDLAENIISWTRLLRACEASKIRLSTEAESVISEEFIANSSNGTPLHLKFRITRSSFENLIRPTLERSLISIRKALEIASITPSDLDRVILVGGSTYIPLVKELLENELKISPQAWINPITVVALGAAIEAGNLAGQSIGPMMMDVTPHTLGISCLNEYDHDVIKPLIRRNTPVPTTASHVFYKMHEMQKAVEIQVYQGESSSPTLNQFLGSFQLEDLDLAPRSQNLELHVKFELDRSGLLNIMATDMASGKQVGHTIRKSSSSRSKNINLVNLETVRISEEVLTPLTEEENGSDDDSLFWQEAENTTSEETDKDNAHLEEENTFKKAQELIQSENLDEKDLSELSSELALAQTGDKEAVQRLSNLVYYLE